MMVFFSVELWNIMYITAIAFTAHTHAHAHAHTHARLHFTTSATIPEAFRLFETK